VPGTLITLHPLRRYSDHSLLALRAFVGAFLVWGVWDNISTAAHMQEFVDFLQTYGFPVPDLSARLSVWTQFVVGVSFVAGALTRWAAFVCIVNFIVAIVMVDRFGGIRGSFPAALLIGISAYLATHGAGRFSVDGWLENRGAKKVVQTRQG
jgi:putative oxidoreductase